MSVSRGHRIIPTPTIMSGGSFAAVADPTQQNPLGAVYETWDDNGYPAVYVYVKFDPTVAQVMALGAPLYAKDPTRSVITNTVTEAATYAAAADSAADSFVGILLNVNVAKSTAPFCWVLAKGWYDKFTIASMVQGDRAVLSNAAASPPTFNTWVRVAAGTAPTPTNADSVFISCTNATSGGLCKGFLNNSYLMI